MVAIQVQEPHCRDIHMPTLEKSVGRKPKGERQQPPEDKKNVKVRAALHRRMSMIAAHRRMDLFDYLDQLLTGQVDRDFDQMLREADKD